jgi:hypothetical protein
MLRAHHPKKIQRKRQHQFHSIVDLTFHSTGPQPDPRAEFFIGFLILQAQLRVGLLGLKKAKMSNQKSYCLVLFYESHFAQLMCNAS